ncbi:MAG: hypothetical protein M1511_09545 [Deltaproteobacteria bacterium]|nr:hypothetical protein [Deltaproteobacteria bacterium]
MTKDSGKWTITVDDIPWHESFDMIWDPVFSPDGLHVAAKAARGSDYLMVIDGKIFQKGFDNLGDPVFSPDGSKLLTKTVEDGRYFRKVVPLGDLL